MTPGDVPVRRLPIGDTLDLHTFKPSDVVSVVEEYLRAAREAGIVEVRVIHGRGHGVQRAMIHGLLHRLPFVVRAYDAPPDRGAWGATVVELTPPAADDPGTR